MTATRRIPVDDGVELLVRLDGDQSDPPVMILHGYLDNSESWGPVATLTARAGFRVVRVDHRGHGRSTDVGDEAAYAFDRLCRDTLAVADELGIESFHLVGHSMGGYLAQMLAIRDAERLSSLVLVGCSPMPGSPDRPIAAHLRRFVGYRVGAGRLVRLLAPVLTRRPFASSPGRTRSELRASLDALGRSAAMQDPAAFVALGEQLQSHDDLRPFLPSIDLPTTVVVGDNEVAKLRAGCEALAVGIPGAVLVVVDEAGHGVPMEQPERFAASLLEHLARARGVIDA